MSRLYVDRISPYQSGSLTIDGFQAEINTGSFATTGSNTFNGNQTVIGKVAATVPLPGSGFEYFTTYTGITGSNNEPLPDSWDALFNFGGTNLGYARNIGDLAKNINTRFLHTPYSLGFLNQPSGSGNVSSHYLYQEGTDTKFDLDATNIRLGGGFTNNIELSGSVLLRDTLTLQAQDPLPAGTLGQLAVSGSDLYFFNGSNWILK